VTSYFQTLVTFYCNGSSVDLWEGGVTGSGWKEEMLIEGPVF